MKSVEPKYKAVSLATQVVGDQTIVLNHKTGKIVSLNQTSAKILSIIKRPLRPREVVSILAKEYSDVSKDDVCNLLKELVSEGLAVFSK